MSFIKNINKFLLPIMSILLFNNQVMANQLKSVKESSLHLQFNTGNEPPYGLPSTIVKIQGKVIPLILDTGASKSEDISLSKDALKNIKVKFTGKNICFKTVDGSRCQKEFIVPELTIGSFTIKNVKGTLMEKLWGFDKGFDKGFRASEAMRSGIIGLPLLSRFNFAIDFPHAALILVTQNSKPSSYNIRNWTSMPFEKNLQTHFKLDGKLISLRWDTGAFPSMINSTVVKNYKSNACPADMGYIMDNCQSVEVAALKTKEGIVLPNTWFKIVNFPAQAPFDGVIGLNFFRENVIYCDFSEHRIYLKHI